MIDWHDLLFGPSSNDFYMVFEIQDNTGRDKRLDRLFLDMDSIASMWMT